MNDSERERFRERLQEQLDRGGSIDDVDLAAATTRDPAFATFRRTLGDLQMGLRSGLDSAASGGRANSVQRALEKAHQATGVRRSHRKPVVFAAAAALVVATTSAIWYTDAVLSTRSVVKEAVVAIVDNMYAGDTGLGTIVVPARYVRSTQDIGMEEGGSAITDDGSTFVDGVMSSVADMVDSMDGAGNGAQ